MFWPLIAALMLYVLRSGRQFSSPELWAEELVFLNLSVTKGIWSSLAPVSGQFIPISNAPVALGALWPQQLPWILALSAGFVFGITGLLFAGPPSRVFGSGTQRWIPLVLALVPVAPEMYGVSLYNFWWVGLWPVAVWTWDLHNRSWRRFGALVVGAAAMTSLAASLAAPIFLGVALLTRSRKTAVLGAAALPGFLVQMLCATNGDRVASEGQNVSALVIQTFHMIGKFAWARLQWFGPPSWPLVEPRQLTAATGLAIVFLFVQASLGLPRSPSIAIRGIVLFVVLFAAISVAARPGQTLHPLAAGPRYFFLPWAVLVVGLLALSLDVRGHTSVRVTSTVVLILGLAALSVGFARPKPTDPVNLRQEIRACASDPAAVSPLRVQEDGFQPLWTFNFPTSWCRAHQ